MSRSALYSKADFFRRMKKKAPLQTILDNLESYTPEQLADSSIGQPLWIRELLVEFRQHDGMTKAEHDQKRADKAAQEIADLMDVPLNYDPREMADTELFETRRWTAPLQYIGDRFKMEIKTGDVFQIYLETNQIRLGSSLVSLNSQEMDALSYNSELVGHLNRKEFYTLNQGVWNKMNGIVNDPIAPAGVDQSPPPGKKTGINPNQIERLGMRKF